MTTAKSSLKLKGRKFYRDGKEVAEIRGYRQFVADRLHADYQVWQNGEKVAGHFCYFADAVNWVRAVLKDCG